jgi:diguanylate cyclase (GGDEF)-like protein
MPELPRFQSAFARVAVDGPLPVRRRRVRWLRRNWWAPVGALAIIVVLVATTQLVLAVAARKDDLRQAQIAVAAAGQTDFAVMHAPIGLIQGQKDNNDEYELSATLRGTLTTQMAGLTRHWPTALARQVSVDAGRVNNQIVALYGLIRQRDLRAAGTLYQRTITPLSDTFTTDLARAQGRLNADTHSAADSAAASALEVAAGAGVLLVLLFLSLGVARRRLERADIEERLLMTLATTDSLSGVSNHRALVLSIRTEIERARRHERPCALLFLDIDRFKQVNDQYGHAVGDMTLAAFARVVNDELRSSDSFGRWGGEEFLAVLPEADRATAVDAAERIRDAVEHHSFPSVAAGNHLTCSIGIAVYPDDRNDFTGLIAAADDAMYTAKAGGRNQCAVAAELVAA